MKYLLILFSLTPLSAFCQNTQAYTPEYRPEKLAEILPKFKPEYVLWTKPPVIKRPVVKDTLPNDTLKAWIIRSVDYSIPICAVYCDTAAAAGDWKEGKNYITDTEKLGPGKAIFLYYEDGVPLKKNDVATLRRYKEIPLVK